MPIMEGTTVGDDVRNKEKALSTELVEKLDEARELAIEVRDKGGRAKEVQEKMSSVRDKAGRAHALAGEIFNLRTKR